MESPPPPPETLIVHRRRVCCDGGQGALGHPRIWLEIDARDYVECPYCDRRYVLEEEAEAGSGH